MTPQDQQHTPEQVSQGGRYAPHPGPTNSLRDVGLSLGHHQRTDDGWLTGTTCVLAPTGGAIAGVDVRGGGPGTRETDLLAPQNAVERINAIVLTGGSAYGLATGSGVADSLGEQGIGLPMGGPNPSGTPEVVPLVPAAVIFDLGRGGQFGNRPDAEFGRLALADAQRDEAAARAEGNVGAGTGAKAGGVKGGLGQASVVLPDGSTVAALAVANPIGSVLDPRTGELYAARFGLGGEFDLELVTGEQLAEALAAADPVPTTQPGRATTLAVVATDAPLSKVQCHKLAQVGHDGLARAIHPVHSMFDGDTVFALSTAAAPADTQPGRAGVPGVDLVTLHQVLQAGADTISRAIGRAVLAAEPAGQWRGYRELFTN